MYSVRLPETLKYTNELLFCIDASTESCIFPSILQDVFGRRGILAISCAVLTIPVFGLLAFTEVHPLVSTLWLGVTYSVAAVSVEYCFVTAGAL